MLSAIAPVLPLMLAPFVGSFLGVVVRRVPRGESVIRPRSHCESCGRVLGAPDLVPVLSFVVLRGRCRHCGAAIGRDHLLVELAALVPPAATLLTLPGAPPSVVAAGSVLGWTLLALAMIDLRHWRLPDALTLPLLVGALGWTAYRTPDALADHAIAALLGWWGLTLVATTYRRLRGRAGLGLGDAKLLGAGGAVLGLDRIGLALLFAALLGIAVALAWHRRAVRGASAIPFGPALAAAIFISWLLEQRGAS